MDKELEKKFARCQAISDQIKAKILDEIKEKYREAHEEPTGAFMGLLEGCRILLTFAAAPGEKPLTIKEGLKCRLLTLGGLLVQEAMAQWHEDGTLSCDMIVMEGSAEEINESSASNSDGEEDEDE